MDTSTRDQQISDFSKTNVAQESFANAMGITVAEIDFKSAAWAGFLTGIQVTFQQLVYAKSNAEPSRETVDARSGGQTTALTLQYIPGNFATHRDSWRDAIVQCINVETQKGNTDQASYWEHELAAYDRSFARLIDNPELVKNADGVARGCFFAVPQEVRIALVKAEAALSDIGDADREPGDDLEWCEKRAAKDLHLVRTALARVQKAAA